MNYSKNSSPFIIAMVIVSLLVGGAVGYYLGYDRGWERAVKQFDVKNIPITPDEAATQPADDGMSMGFIKRVYEQDGTWYAEIDFAMWHMGDEAIELAIADTGCSREEVAGCVASLNNGFYIRNLEPQRQSFVMNEETEIRLLNPNAEGVVSDDDPFKTVSVDEYIDAFNRASRNDELIRFSPYNVVIVDDTFSSIEQRYTP